MRRRLLDQVFQRQDTCLLCASRLRPNPSLRNRKPYPTCRTLVTSARLLQSPASQPKEDDDGEFSMLKQNAGLSFPSRAKPQPPSPSTSAEELRFKIKRRPVKTSKNDSRDSPDRQTSSTTPNGLANQSMRQSHRDTNWHSDSRSRPSYDAQRSSQQNVNHATKRDGPLIRSIYGRRNSNNTAANSPSLLQYIPPKLDNELSPRRRRVDERYGPQRISDQQALNGQYSAPSQAGFRIQRFTISETDSTGKSKMVSQEMKHGARRLKLDHSNDLESMPAARSSDNKNANGNISAEATELIPDVFDAPAGSSFDALDSSHHRRHTKEDRRARRSDRFDDGDEQSIAQNATQKSKTHRRGFDMQAYEAEEMLYGEGGRRKKKKTKSLEPVASSKPVLHLPEFVGVEKLAQMLKINVDSFIEKLEEEGYEGARYDHVLDSGTSAMFADLYGFEPVIAGTGSTADLTARPPPEDLSILPPRPPIVTIMGHVDHGKTTILDFFRKSSVVASEHGGITQHIGAFSVSMPGSKRQITFLDTPGHAAFLEMRRRGANVTDIVVLVVAADDSVKPQTIEAIKHALEANVQIIVAINKIDKPEADIERVKQDLTRHDIVVEDYGGDYQVIPVSGKTGKGMSDLEEAIMTLSDVNDYRAEIDGPAEGWVIESKVTISGRVATVLVRRGTLRIGDCIVAGTTWARVRTLRNDAGALVDAAPPGTPVQVDGWRGQDPTAGLEVLQADDEDHAKEIVDLRLEQEENMKTAANMTAINSARSEEAEARAKVLAWEREQEWSKKSHWRRPKDNEGWVEAEDSAGPKKIHFVIKADVAGSVEALVAAVGGIGNNEIVANIIHSSTGQLTESDIRMLATTGERGYAICFNQPIDGNVARLAEAAGLSVLEHNIIYKVTDNVRDILADHLPPVITQRVLGEAEIGQIFEITVKRRKVKIAGCRVTNGTISRSSKIRVQRGNEVVYTGALDSLKNVKKDVTEMRKGTECGMAFEEWEDFQEGDQIQCFEEHMEKRTFY